MLDKMKIIVLIFVFGFCFLEQGFTQDAYQGETIESSLQSLKDSAKVATIQNDQLYEKNEALMKKIQFLKARKLFLEEQKTELFEAKAFDDGFDADKEQERAKFLEDGVNSSLEQIHQVKKEQARLNKSLSIKDAQRNESKDKAIAIRAEISKLIKRQDALKRNLLDRSELAKKEHLLSMLREIDVEIENHQEQLAKYKKQGSSIALSVDQLKQENDQLVGEIKILLKKVKLLEAQDRQAQENLSQIIYQNDDQMKELSKEIASLEKRRFEIENVFNQAREKIQKQNVDLAAHGEMKESHIEENMKIIQKENVDLKREIKTLERLLREVE